MAAFNTVAVACVADAGAALLPRVPGLPDEAFVHDGQLTKREVRAVSLYSLGLRHDSVVWDIGAGTGPISVEASLICWQGTVYAIERDQDSLPLLQANVDKWGSDNVRVVSGEAPQALDGLPDPDAVFVGGSGGHLNDILVTVSARLKPGGRLVVNLAALDRTQQVYNTLKAMEFQPEMAMVSSARGKEMPDGAIRLESLNPVFVVTGQRKG